MKTGKDFREAFPAMDEDFRYAVFHALEETGKEREPMKRKIGAGAALIAAIVMLTAVAAAAVAGQWGLMDFLEGKSQPEAGKMITQVEGAVAETGLATFNLKEALYDGYGVYLTVNVKAKDADTLPLPGGVTESGKVSRLNVDSDMSIAAYAAEMGKSKFLSVNVAQQSSGKGEHLTGFSSSRSRLEEDGSLTIMLSGLRSGEGIGADVVNIGLNCGASRGDLTDTDEWMYWDDVESTALELTLERMDCQITQSVSADEIVLESLNVTVHEVKLVETPLAVYFDVDFTCDPNAIRPPDFGINSAGKIVRSDVALISAYTPVDRARGHWRMRGTLPTMDELPDMLELKVTLVGEKGMGASEMTMVLMKQE